MCLDQRAYLANHPRQLWFIHRVKKSIRLTKRQEI
jgi:hypothetical protein